jgi:predicted aspartyl protease
MWIYVLKLSQDVTGSTGSTVVTLQVYDRIIYSSFSRKWDIGLL